VSLGECGARGHFRNDKTGAMPLSQPTEWRIGNTRHGRQNRTVRHRNAAYGPGIAAKRADFCHQVALAYVLG
jgi:hypothetical protein